MPHKSVLLWEGRLLQELTKEELIHAVEELFGMLAEANDEHKRTVRLWKSFSERRMAT